MLKIVGVIILPLLLLTSDAEAKRLEVTDEEIAKVTKLQEKLAGSVMKILSSKCPKYKEAFESKTDISSLMAIDVESLKASGEIDSKELNEAQECITNAFQSPEFLKLIEGVSLTSAK